MLSRASHPPNEGRLMIANNNISWLILKHMHQQNGKEKQRRKLQSKARLVFVMGMMENTGDLAFSCTLCGGEHRNKCCPQLYICAESMLSWFLSCFPVNDCSRCSEHLGVWDVEFLYEEFDWRLLAETFSICSRAFLSSLRAYLLSWGSGLHYNLKAFLLALVLTRAVSSSQSLLSLISVPLL